MITDESKRGREKTPRRLENGTRPNGVATPCRRHRGTAAGSLKKIVMVLSKGRGHQLTDLKTSLTGSGGLRE